MAIGVTAKLQVLTGRNQEFEIIFKQLVSSVLANEKGCLVYALHQSREDTQSYIVLEQYVDEAALQSHSTTDHYRNFGKQISVYLAAAPEIVLMDSI
ncbi:MAG: quinol monooxygenase YgiN [Candidatus Omnitrophota bacterium]|jgi:quinol monooxygenase YgiN